GLEFSADDPLPAEPLMRGRHNREDAVAATLAARAAGIDDEAIAAALRTFEGVPHRLETVTRRRGVRYVNDSKATNAAAAIRALEAYADTPVLLIAGGRGKHESFEPLAAALGPNVRVVYTIGEASHELAAAIGYRAAEVGDLTIAVALAGTRANPGDVVLLSPACASYDQFENFAEPGRACSSAASSSSRSCSSRDSA